MLLKSFKGPSQLAFGEGIGITIMLFLKEEFSPRGLHRHLALLLDLHHCSQLADLMDGYHSTSLQLQLVAGLLQVGGLKLRAALSKPSFLLH